jgi:hypothetical protein
MVMFQSSVLSFWTAIIILLGLGACNPAPKDNAVALPETSASMPSVTDGTATSNTGNALADEARSSPATGVSAPDQPEPKLSEYGESAVIAVDGQGLRLFDPKTKAAAQIAFGWSKTDVLAVLLRLRGPSDNGTIEDCGDLYYAKWPDGLNLVFENDRFAGWGLDRRAAGVFASASGIGPGSTRNQLNTAHADVQVEDSSLGVEFEAAGYAGVLDGPKKSAKITDMWAGKVCIAR